MTLAKEAAKDGVKRYITGILVNGDLTCLSGGLPRLTNATKVVKYSKDCHSACAAVWRTCHNIAELYVIMLFLVSMFLHVGTLIMIYFPRQRMSSISL